MRSVCALLVLAALSPASALRPATLNGRRAPASAAIDRRALLGAAVFAVAAPRSAHAALRGDEDPVIRDVQNLLEFEEIKKNGVEGLTPTASVKVGGLKGDIKVELNVDANGDQKYLWFTDAATRQVLKAKIVQGAKVRRRPDQSNTRIPYISNPSRPSLSTPLSASRRTHRTAAPSPLAFPGASRSSRPRYACPLIHA